MDWSSLIRNDIEMSHIDSTRKSYSSPYEITVCMTKEECKILLPFFQKAYKSVKSKYEKYNDIHNGGEATEREVSIHTPTQGVTMDFLPATLQTVMFQSTHPRRV